MKVGTNIRGVLSSFVILLCLSFVLAQVGGGSGSGGPISTIGGFVEQLFDSIAPFLEVVLGQETPTSISTSSDYLIRVLLFIIIFALMWATVTRMDFFNQYPAIEWVITIAVSILATRWMASEAAPELVHTILLPYNAIGISMTAFLPLIIYFFFLEVGFGGRKNRFIRKAGWIFLAVVFMFLWFSRANTVGYDSNLATSGLLVYPISAALCIAFSFFDQTIQGFRERAKIDRLSSSWVEKQKIAYEVEMKNISELLENPHMSKYDRDKKEQQLENIRKAYAKLASR